MPVVIWQGKDEQATPYGEQPRYDVQWHANGSTLTSAITAACASNLPATYNGLPLIGVQQIHRGAGFWDITAQYGLWNQTEQLTGQIGGGTVHLTNSLRTKSIQEEAGASVDVTTFGSLIGVNGNNVAGVDIPDNIFAFTIRKKYLASTLASNFIQNCKALTNTTNNANLTYTWRGQALTAFRGELIFRGLEFSDGQADLNGSPYIEFNFKFELSENVTLSIAGIDNIEKNGWDVLWMHTVATNVGAGSLRATVQQPDLAIVEQVYDEGDFSSLGLFTIEGTLNTVILTPATALTDGGNWTVPLGVTNLATVELWGSGGGGAGGQSGGAGGGGGGGGGGGYLRYFNYPVTPAATMPYEAPVGGAGGAINTDGTAGNAAVFNVGGGDATLIAGGGFAGQDTHLGGLGGDGDGPFGSYTASGGAGGSGDNISIVNNGGGGGGSGSQFSPGDNGGSNITPGDTAGGFGQATGGDGGYGGADNATAGGNPGAGGGGGCGAGSALGFTAHAGKAGGNARIQITYFT